jgi:hypothetical protein
VGEQILRGDHTPTAAAQIQCGSSKSALSSDYTAQELSNAITVTAIIT